MSPSNRAPSLTESVNAWLRAIEDGDCSHPGSKNYIQGQLRAWIDLRFDIYTRMRAARIRCHDLIQVHLNSVQNNPGQNDDRFAIIRAVARLEELNQRLNVQNMEAAFLCRSLKLRYGLDWQDLDVGKYIKTFTDTTTTVNGNGDVVGALMALGQADITMKTLDDLKAAQDAERQPVEDALQQFKRLDGFGCGS